MLLELSQLSPRQRYQVLVQTIIPRPIAWVLSDNGTGKGPARYNLAPFSFFNAMASTPPLVVLGIAKKSDKSPKDTLVNLERRGWATIHIGGAEHADDMWDSAAELPHGASELLRRDYQLEDGPPGCLPRLNNCAIALFSRFHHLHMIDGCNTAIVFCEIKHIYMNDTVAQQEDGIITVDALKIGPLGRLGGADYTIVNNAHAAPRPKD